MGRNKLPFRDENKDVLRRIYTYSGIAAAVILLFGVGFFMQSKHTNIYTPTSVATLNSDINNQDNNKILAFTSTPHSIPEIKKKREEYTVEHLAPGSGFYLHFNQFGERAAGR